MTKIIEFDKNFSAENSVDKIIHGDCLEVMKKFPEKFVDVVITSPPYNLLNSTDNGLKKNTNCGKWKNAAIKNGYAEYDDNLPYAEYISWQKKCVAEMCRIIKDDGAINFNAGYFLPTTEQIYLICKKNFKLAKGANKNTDVWEVKQEMKNPHPAPFPEELIDKIVSSTTGKVILDPFAGSGTTAISAKKFDRNFILIEKSLKYCEMAQKRIDGGDWRNAENNSRENSVKLF